MYPMVSWGYQPLIDRLNRLLQADLLFEAVFATCATHEQCFKRLVRGELTRQRQTIRQENWSLVLRDASTAKDLDDGMRLLQGIKDIKDGWKLTFAGYPVTTLPTAVNRANGVWHNVPPLFKIRNRLAHGTASPGREDLRRNASDGIENLTRILNPASGLGTLGMGDPFARLPNIRHVR
jgi:hypothetical protein